MNCTMPSISDPIHTPLSGQCCCECKKKVIIIIKRFFPIVKRIVIASFKIQIRAVPYYSFANVIDDICTYYKYKVCSVYICTVGPYIVRICIVHSWNFFQTALLQIPHIKIWTIQVPIYFKVLVKSYLEYFLDTLAYYART